MTQALTGFDLNELANQLNRLEIPAMQEESLLDKLARAIPLALAGAADVRTGERYATPVVSSLLPPTPEDKLSRDYAMMKARQDLITNKLNTMLGISSEEREVAQEQRAERKEKRDIEREKFDIGQERIRTILDLSQERRAARSEEVEYATKETNRKIAEMRLKDIEEQKIKTEELAKQFENEGDTLTASIIRVGGADVLPSIVSAQSRENLKEPKTLKEQIDFIGDTDEEVQRAYAYGEKDEGDKIKYQKAAILNDPNDSAILKALALKTMNIFYEQKASKENYANDRGVISNYDYEEDYLNAIKEVLDKEPALLNQIRGNNEYEDFVKFIELRTPKHKGKVAAKLLGQKQPRIGGWFRENIAD